MIRAFAGLGSNVGDRLANLEQAVATLASTEQIEVVAVSRIYETDPIGPPQPDYLNAVVELRTTLSPRDLLEAVQRAEARVGRTPAERWGPREIDIDLLIYGDERIDDPGLRIPHLGLVRRAFVLVPLHDLAPDLDVPGAGPVSDLLARVDRAGVRPTTLSLTVC